MHHDAIVRMNGYTSCMIYHRPCLQYCSWRSAWFVTRKQFDVHWNILHVAGHKSNDWKNKKNAKCLCDLCWFGNHFFDSCFSNLHGISCLIGGFCRQKRRSPTNPLISQPTTSDEAAVGAFCSTSTCDLAMPYLWHPGSTSRHGLGHLELVEILPCLGGGKRWVYLWISHWKNGGESWNHPSIPSFLVGNGSTLWENTWNTQNDWVIIFCSLLGCAYLVVQNSHCQGLLGRLEGSCLDLSICQTGEQ